MAPPDMATVASPLHQALTSLPPANFAVLDGALDPGLAQTLAAADLAASPLYLEGGDPQTVASGPLLVALPDPASLDRLLEAPAGATAVFWSWPGGLDTLRRHLRSINLVEVPADTVGESGGGLATVILRHWDPNVVAPLLPLLTPEQESRFLGDAAGLAFDSADYDGLVAITPRAGLPQKPKGMLRITPEQMAALSQARVAASRRRVAGYLRESAPAHTAPVDDAELLRRVVLCETEAQALGLRTEADIARWSFLQVMAGGVLFGMPMVRDQFAPGGGRSPTETLDAIFDDLVHRLKGRG